MRSRLRLDPGAVLRIARWEVRRSAATLDRRIAALALAALLLAGGVTAAGAATGPALDRGIYRVGVAPDSPYHGPVEAAPALAARPPEPAAFRAGDLELLLVGRELRIRDTRKGRAALARFRDAVRAHNARLMDRESNQSAAYPVVVILQYVDRTAVETDAGSRARGSDGDDGGRGAGGASGGSDDGAVGGVGGTGDDGVAVPDVGGGSVGPFGGRTSGSPAEISPPFPFGSLILAFAFLVPMNFVVQAYGSTMLGERINRRGELLLVSPASPTDIVAGKTLPYAGAMVAATGVVALAVGGGLLSVAAVLPVALVFLGATFVGAMFARSFKELTFVTVTVSVLLTAYTFVPAIFTDVTPVALISPLTVVVRDLQDAGVTAGEYLFATGPMYLVGVGLFVLGIGVYREEDLFTQRAVPLKLLDALEARLDRPRSVAVVAALSIPFVMVAELLVVALLFALPGRIALPVLVVAVAAVEEVAKSLHVYAGFHAGTFDRIGRTALLLGGLAGLGFFVGEKLLIVLQLVGLSRVPLGRATVATAGVGGLPGGALLVAPLALHVVTASLTATAAARGLRAYVGGLVAATAVHAAYNLTVVTALG